ncbi:MAG: tRNA (N(6)-L-threonylcarbamoyladenosine(37)-C(2))-methylthiotransferase MtaB [Dethiobacteria bacterium]
MSLKAAFYTLGCKVNYYDTEALKEEFRREGFEIVDFKEPADVYVVNTCTVTHQADRKSRQMVRRAKRRHPGALVAAIGCYTQVNPNAGAALPAADLLAGTAGRLSLPQQVKRKLAGEDVAATLVKPYGPKAAFEEMPFLPEQSRARAFLKIQDGCNQYCSYCIIPYARGPLRSLPLPKGLQYLQEISAAGFKEVVFTGIHLGLYGVDLDPPLNLAAFLQEAAQVPGLVRIRLSSIEPTDCTEELIAVLQSREKICRHLHIPLQSGDDTILKQMGRPYDTAFYAALLKRLRQALPDLAVSTDIMVGFPGEEAAHFQNSIDFVRECAFSRLHVFRYSPRPDTKAAAIAPQVSPPAKEQRSQALLSLGKTQAAAFQAGFTGRRLPVLFENELTGADRRAAVRQLRAKAETKQADRSYYAGLTSNYLRVHAALPPGHWRGKIGTVRMVKSCPGHLLGCFAE